MTPWVHWEKIVIPKGLGGWGLKNIFLFAKYLAAKGGWRLLKTVSLWTKVIIQKYIAPDSIENWIRSPRKTHTGGSVIWKAVVLSFGVIESNLAWKVGNGRKLRVGEEPWVAFSQQHRLSGHTVEALKQRGLVYLSQFASLVQENTRSQSWKAASDFGLSEPNERDLERLLGALHRAQIQLRDREDELI